MRFYAVGGGGDTVHAATLVDARKTVRERVKNPGTDWRDVYVDEVEVQTDKAGILKLLNYEGGTHTYLRQWGATARGGLKLQEREE
jgi:hypothetical protein